MRFLVPILCVAVIGTGIAADPSSANAALFKALDTNHSGTLDIDEFLAGFRQGKPMDASRAARLGRQFALMDRNRDEKLTLDEFLDYYHPKPAASAKVAVVAPVTVAAPAPVASKPTPPAKAPAPAKAAVPESDDEKDEVDQNVAKKIELHPWTDGQRRSVENTFLPGATTVQKGHFHYRIVHVAREVWYEDTTTNLMGLDDSVKIGFQLGYGITDNLDVNITRSNGRTLQLSGRPINMDYWDVLFKYRLMDQNDNGFADLAVVGGVTAMVRNHGKADLSLDTQIVLERNMFSDRLRLGIGIARAGLSSYEPINGLGPGIKYLPEEYEQKQLTDPLIEIPERGTTSIPITAKVALSERWQWFGDMIIPVRGFRTTDGGPSVATGIRFNTHTHEYSVYFANTVNTSFNTVLTGGANGWSNLPVFGFSIVAHL